jgi:hypothetical protein
MLLALLALSAVLAGRLSSVRRLLPAWLHG